MESYWKELYQWYKSHGICTSCHHAKSIPGQVCCEACREKKLSARKKAVANASDAEKAHWRQQQRDRRQRFEAQGLCTSCGKAPHAPGRKHCEACLRKKREAAKKYSKKGIWKKLTA